MGLQIGECAGSAGITAVHALSVAYLPCIRGRSRTITGGLVAGAICLLTALLLLLLLLLSFSFSFSVISSSQQRYSNSRLLFGRSNNLRSASSSSTDHASLIQDNGNFFEWNWSVNLILSRPLSRPLSPDDSCEIQNISNLVVARNNSALYYVLDQNCPQNSFWTIFRTRLPYGHPENLTSSLAPFMSRAQTLVSPVVDSRLRLDGMDLLENDTNLILSLSFPGSSRDNRNESLDQLTLGILPTNEDNPKLRPILRNVSRNHPPRSLALRGPKDLLYVATNDKSNLLSYAEKIPSVNDTLQLQGVFVENLTTDMGLWLSLSAQNFPSSAACMYVRDNESLMLIRLSTNAKGSLSWRQKFERVTDVAVTRDGCSVFVSREDKEGNGYIQWIKTEVDCPLNFSYGETVASYKGAGVSWLALGETETAGSAVDLYVATSDGKLFAIALNGSKMACQFQPHQLPSQSVPSPPNSSVPSPPGTRPTQASGYHPDHGVISSFASAALPDKSSGGSGLSGKTKIAVGVAAVALIVATTAFVCFVARRRSSSSSSAGRRALEKRNLSSSAGSTEQPIISSGDPDAERARVADSSGLQSSRIPIALPVSPAPAPSCKLFTLSSLSACTDNFAESHKVPVASTCGTFGEVYRGTVGGMDVAMKLRRGVSLTENLRRQFLWEVSTWSRLQHDHLIPLLGYCQEEDHCILVYPYFSEGNLHSRLHDRMRLGVGGGGGGGNGLPSPPPLPPALTLIQRLQIGFQIAKAVQYLHERSGQPIIHRSIKSSNVLLTNQAGGQPTGGGGGGEVRSVLTDCGWATICEKVYEVTHDEFVKAATASGTFGYISPEYLLAAQLSEKNDVYGVGVILFEMLTGRKAVMLAPSGIGCMTLADWANPFLRDRKPSPSPNAGNPHPIAPSNLPSNLPPGPPPAVAAGPQRANLPQALLDSSLKEQATMPLMKKMAMKALQLASKCTDDEEKRRPSIGSVVDELRRILILGEPESRTFSLIRR